MRVYELCDTQYLRISIAYSIFLWYDERRGDENDPEKSSQTKKMTQVECAKYLGIPIRTYQNYELDESKSSSMKYAFMMQKLEQYGFIDESHGILTTQQIKDACSEAFNGLDIEYCYLFGSYAKGGATEVSDVDLLISTSISGMRFFDLVESLREKLQKKVDVLNREQLNNNPTLINEILKNGVVIED